MFECNLYVNLQSKMVAVGGEWKQMSEDEKSVSIQIIPYCYKAMDSIGNYSK